VKEIGWHEVKQSGRSSPWLAGLPLSFEVFHWHGETFDLPPGAEHLLQSSWCRNQAFAYDNMLALQFHVEMTADMVKEWATLYRQELVNPCASVQSYDAMISTLDMRIKNLQAVADVIYDQWLTMAADDLPSI
jgi:hypothetical protein